MHFSLESPGYLLLLPIWVGLGWLSLRVRLPLGYVPDRRGLGLTLRAFLPGWGSALLGGLGSIALSEPMLHLSVQRPCLPDTWVLWDISRSMRLADLTPNRQTIAAERMETALRSLPCGRLGLIAFAADAYAIIPLTTDREAFLFSLRQTLRLDLGEGTDLAAAIETALGLPAPPTQLLIVSDGAHNVPGSASLTLLADRAREQGVTIHTIFVGGEGEQAFPQALRLLSMRTGGSFQERDFTLEPLLQFQTQIALYPLASYLWLTIIIGGLLMLTAMALYGWFNVLTT